MPTLRAIAELAECSVATVSRVLNGGQGVRPETVARVQRAELRLRQTETEDLVRTLAVIVPDLLNPYFVQLVRGMEEEVKRQGCMLMVCNLNRDVETAERCVRFLQDRCIDRVIIGGGGVITSAYREIWARLLAQARVVTVGDHSLGCPAVLVDDVQGAAQAVEHLVGYGHQQIAMICGPSNSVPSLHRMEGYMSTLFKHRLPYVSDLIFEGDYTAESGYLAGQRLLGQQSLPTAVFCSNDMMAHGLMRAMSEAGLRVPRDISVIGYDGLDVFSYNMVRLTSVAVPMASLGREAVQLLLSGGHGNAGMVRVTLATELRAGETVAPPREIDHCIR